MYCNFNPRLFKSFISKGKKILPALADDWEIIPDQFRKVDGFSLKSEKLDQEVADINLRMFLRFCKEQSLTINGLKLVGKLIIGNDRKIYTEEMFNKWSTKYTKRTESIIAKKDYIPGHVYKTPCGAEIIYLGCRYVIQLKDDKDFSKHTKLVKKYYYCNNIRYGSDFYYIARELKMKLTKDLGVSDILSSKKCGKILDNFYHKNKEIIYFEKEKPGNVAYEIVEDKEVLVSKMLVSIKGKDGLYTTGRFHFNNNGFTRVFYKLNADFTLTGIRANELGNMGIDRTYRINITKGM